MQSSSKKSDGREKLIRTARSISTRTERNKGLGRGTAKAEMGLGIGTRRYLGCSGSSPLLRGSAAAPGAHKPPGWVRARPGSSGSWDLTGARSLPPGPSFTAPLRPAGVVRGGRPGRGLWAAPGAPAREGCGHRAAGQGHSKVICLGQVRSWCYSCQGLRLPLHPPGSSSSPSPQPWHCRWGRTGGDCASTCPNLGCQP